MYIILLAMAVSLDSFGVGIAYGLRDMKTPFSSLAVIGLCSGVLMSISMILGDLISGTLSPKFSTMLGGVTLIFVGLWQLIGAFRSKVSQWKNKAFSLNLKPLGIVIKIFLDPIEADMDFSGYIDIKEALALGIALGLDAFGAGLGIAMAGISMTIIPYIIIGSMSFVALGQRLAATKIKNMGKDRWSLLPGIMLIIIGLGKIL